MTPSHRRFKVAATSAGLLVLLVAGAALAQSAASDKFRTGDSVTIPAGETVANDLYAFAGTVRIDGTLDGDLVATGGTIDVSGSVTGDVLVAGGTVSIPGTVGGDARIAGGTLTVGGAVTEDLLAAGGQVTLASAGTVGEDVFASAGQLAIDGDVTGDLTASTGTYTKTGTVGGAEDITITTASDQPTTPVVEQTPTDRVIDAVRHFLVVLVAGIALIWLVPRAYAAMKSALQQRPLPSAGWGIAAMVGYVVVLIMITLAMIILAILFGALGFGDLVGIDVVGGIVAILGVTLAFLIVCAYIADAIVGVTLAGLVMRDRATTRPRELGLLAAGAAVVVLVSSLPVVGPWVKLVVIVLGLGAVVIAVMRARSSGVPAEPIVPASPAPPPPA